MAAAADGRRAPAGCVPRLATQVDIAFDGTRRDFDDLLCAPSPPPPPPSPPPPSPIDCVALVPDGGRCGAPPLAADAVCWHCCSSQGFCGTDDGGGLWCGEGNQPQFSYAKLDPGSAQCGTHTTVVFGARQCVTDPATGRQHCVALPEGRDVNSEDPATQAMLKRVFSL